MAFLFTWGVFIFKLLLHSILNIATTKFLFQNNTICLDVVLLA